MLIQPHSDGVEVESPSLVMLLAVALAYGVSDAGNNLSLNTIIGRLFSERSEVLFFNSSYNKALVQSLKKSKNKIMDVK